MEKKRSGVALTDRPWAVHRLAAILAAIAESGSPASGPLTAERVAQLDVEALELQDRGEYPQWEPTVYWLLAALNAPETKDHDLLEKLCECQFDDEEISRMIYLRQCSMGETAQA